MSNQSRREFLQTVTLAAPALAGTAAFAWPPTQEWDVVRRDFLIPADRIYLNVGTLGVQPKQVVAAVLDYTRKTAESLPPGVQWDALKNRMAALLNCDGAGLVFPRNTTEAMNFVANGLELSAGDEVITTNHEHVGGLCCWQLIAARRKVRLTQVDLGHAPRDAAAVLALLSEAITPATRVVSISHVNFTTGFVMPVREVVELCRRRGIISVIDGAHPPGLIRVDLRALDPDFYASSPHKWLLAPQGTGLLYMREEWRTKLWPTLASGGWDDLKLGAHRFNHLGTLDESRLAGLDAALLYHERLGPPRVYARIEELRQALIRRLTANARVRLMSPRDAQGAGMVSFLVDGISALDLQKKFAERNVRTRVVGEYDYGFMRLSPHVYTNIKELDIVTDLIARS